MVRKRASIGRMLANVIVGLRLCGIVCGEIPELLTLTGNATNDYTIRTTNSAISPLLREASTRVRVTGVAELNIPACEMMLVFFAYSKGRRFSQTPPSVARSRVLFLRVGIA